MLGAFIAQPESRSFPRRWCAPRAGFIKGQIPRERIIKDYGDAALPLFNDMTTGKLNPNPKPEEISLAFKNEFESLLPQTSLSSDKQAKLKELYQQVQKSKAPTPEARAQQELVPQIVLPAGAHSLLREPGHRSSGCAFCATHARAHRAIGRERPAGYSRCKIGDAGRGIAGAGGESGLSARHHQQHWHERRHGGDLCAACAPASRGEGERPGLFRDGFRQTSVAFEDAAQTGDE